MSEHAVASSMALLAIVTAAVALLFGLLMQRRGWSRQFVTKLRLAFAVVCVQTVLTASTVLIESPALFLTWLMVAAVAIGVGVPVTFSLTVDLVPTRDRGYVAALITAATYFMGAVFAAPWSLERFRAQLLGVMLLGTVALGVLAFRRFAFIEALAAQHRQPGFGRGRFVSISAQGRPVVRRNLFVLILLMFAIFFIDSLGFLRLIETPMYMDSAWQSPEWSPRLMIGGAHVLAALIAGVLYTALNERQLFFWIFGIFALALLIYLFDLRLAPLLPESGPTLAMPLLYAMAVSLYTVVNFAIWADVATPETISVRAAIGVAISGWTATFISTALALQWGGSGMSLDRHLSIVAALALMGFIALLSVSFFRARPAHPLQDRSA